jgi:hypothetical protein
MYSGEKQDASASKKSMVLGSGSPGPSGKMNKAMLLLCVLGLIRIIPLPPRISQTRGTRSERIMRFTHKVNKMTMKATETVVMHVEGIYKSQGRRGQQAQGTILSPSKKYSEFQDTE